MTPVDIPAPAPYDAAQDKAPPVHTFSAITPTTTLGRAPRSLPAIWPGKGVQQNVSLKSSFKFGAITVKQTAEDSWLIRYHDPASGRDVRRKLDGISRRDLDRTIANINQQIRIHGGYIPGSRPILPTIAEGVAEAINLRNTLESTRADRAQRAMKFCRWLGEKHPTVERWDQLRPQHLQQFVVERERGGSAFNTVRLDIEPIKTAWRHLSENYPDYIRPLPRIRLRTPPKREIRCLEAAELCILIDWLAENAPDLHGMACLQALAGLRVTEAAALRVNDVDFAERTITVCDTGSHRPKNAASWRTIPVCSEVLQALEAAIKRQRIIPRTGEIFINSHGNPWQRTALGHRWTITLRRAAKATDRPRLAQIPSKGLRRAYATLASRLGAPDRLLAACMGHTAGDVLGGYYRRIDLAELRTVSGIIETWRGTPAGASGNNLASGGAS